MVLPFVSGAGIKNKLLEAASMSRPIIASTSALNGVERGSWTPVQSASGRSAWIKAIKQLWENPERRQQLGTDARQWVTSMHTWDTAADRVLTGLQFTRRETKAVEILEPALIGRR